MNQTEIRLFREPFHYLVVKNLYSKEESNDILNSFLKLYESGELNDPIKTGTAKDGETILKNNEALFITSFDDEKAREFISRPLDIIYTDDVADDSWFFDTIDADDYKGLISYYDHQQNYKPHRDSSKITALTWFYKEPKRFKGGELVFNDYDITIPCEQNLTVMFPGNIKHSVTDVLIEEEYRNKGFGRFTLTSFFTNAN